MNPRRTTLSIGIAAALLMAAWGVAQRASGPGASPAAPVVVPHTVGTSGAMAPAPAVASAASTAAAVPADAPAAATARPSAASAAPLPRAEERAEVCGHGLLLQEDVHRLYPKEVQWDVRQRLIDTLFGGDARQQALAWLLSTSLAQDRAMAAASPSCGTDPDCAQAARHSVAGVAMAANAALVELAVHSADPWVYAIAVSYGCRFGSAGDASARGACARLTPEQWRQRAGDDAAPWLWQASQARQRGDAPAMRDALAAASRQPRLSSPWMQLMQPLQALADWREIDPVHRLVVMIELIGRSAALSMDPTLTRNFCKPDTRPDPEQAAICAGLVRLLSSDSATLIEHRVAARIARDQAWPADPLRALEDFRDASQAMQADAGSKAHLILSCGEIEAAQKRMVEGAAFGEVGAMRKAIAGSGRPLEEWARITRDRRPGRQAVPAPASN